MEPVKRVSVTVPEDVELDIDGGIVRVKGERGQLERDFSHAQVALRKEADKVLIETYWPKKRQIALVSTVRAHINNMIKGVTKGFTYKLKIVYAHFPISVKVTGDTVLIENFCGEKRARRAKIVEGTTVTVDGDDVIVRGVDLEKVSQTAANIQLATKIKKKDPRVFLDGIYVYEKSEGWD